MNESAEGFSMKIKSSIRSLLLLMGALFFFAAPSFAQIGISVSFGPPAIPVYEQPACPQEGFIWTPGYWNYEDDGGYYWVPGTWIEAPQPNFLWTPGYWGWGGSAFLWHGGYWGPTVGFYGGINYGFGYGGHGYEGGYWNSGHFFYNREVTNVNVTVIHNTYNKTVIVNNTRVSYNGGNGGVEARATAQEEAYDREKHVGPVAAQEQHVQEARRNPELRASANQGKPPIAATQRPGEFKGNGVVASREAGGAYKAPERTNEPARTANEPGRVANAPEHTENAPAKPTHVKDIPAATRTAPNTGNAATDKKYQAQQDKMYAKQDKERTSLQNKQEADHQKLTAQKASDARTQQLEQQHTQQTQQLQQRHETQQKQMAAKQAPKPAPAQHESGGKPK
jgi:WXXGXW repeat (2 copies)